MKYCRDMQVQTVHDNYIVTSLCVCVCVYGTLHAGVQDNYVVGMGLIQLEYCVLLI